jgi:hypothetical protein
MLVEIAGLGVEIKGDHEIVDLLEEDYEEFPETENTFLSFEFVSGFPKETPEKPYIDLRTRNWSKPLRNMVGSRETLIEIDESDKSVTVYCSPTIENRNIINSLHKFYDQTYLGRTGVMAIDVTYGIIEPLFNYFGVEEGRCLIHASAVKYDGETMVFAGEGGVGKTSMLLSTPKEDAEFFGDDFVGIDADGNIYPYPKKLMIYGHNTLGLDYDNPSDSIFDRMHWNARFSISPSMVRRRIKFNELGFDTANKDSDPELYFLGRHNGEAQQKTIPKEQMTTSIVETTYAEHKQLLDQVTQDLEHDLAKVVGGYVENSKRNKRTKIPGEWSPVELSRFMYD